MKAHCTILAGQVLATAAVSLLAVHLSGGGHAVVALQAAAFAVGALFAAPLAAPLAALLAAPPAARSDRAAPHRISHWIPHGILIAVALAAAAACLSGTGAGMPHRWLRAGPVMLHPASLAGSLLLVALARAPRSPACALLAGLALLLFGIGNDRAASLAFALGLTGLAAAGRAGRRTLAPLCLLAWGMLAWSLVRPDPMAPVPYVEEVIAHTFAASRAAGLAAVLAVAALPLPFLLAARPAGAGPGLGLGLGGFWLGLVVAGCAGNYPVPVVGYGASPVIGWIVALGLTARRPAPAIRSPFPAAP